MDAADVQAAITEAENLIQETLAGLEEKTGGEVEQVEIDSRYAGGIRVSIMMNG